jgi:alpha-galactosidase
VSFINRDKISLPEVMGHLKDHYNATDPVILHWLFPGKDLHNRLRALVDDQACLRCVHLLLMQALQIYLLSLLC